MLGTVKFVSHIHVLYAKQVFKLNKFSGKQLITYFPCFWVDQYISPVIHGANPHPRLMQWSPELPWWTLTGIPGQVVENGFLNLSSIYMYGIHKCIFASQGCRSRPRLSSPLADWAGFCNSRGSPSVFTSPGYKDDITFDQWVLLTVSCFR